MSSDANTRLVGVSVTGGAEPWERLGFDSGEWGFAAGEVAIILASGGEPPGLAFDRDVSGIDALVAGTARPREEPLREQRHPNNVVGIDHVVITTPDVDRTSAALERTGLRYLGRRSAQVGGRPLDQRFHHAGTCLLEVVGDEGLHGNGEPSVWGVTFVTPDLDALAALNPPPVASIRDAVQPGRRIATAAGEAGLAVRVAFMDPRPAKEPA